MPAALLKGFAMISTVLSYLCKVELKVINLNICQTYCTLNISEDMCQISSVSHIVKLIK